MVPEILARKKLMTVVEQAYKDLASLKMCTSLSGQSCIHSVAQRWLACMITSWRWKAWEADRCVVDKFNPEETRIKSRCVIA